MKMFGGPASTNIKLTLLALAIAIALGTLYYTQSLVEKLQDRERQIVELYANSLEYVANTEIINTDYTFIFENIIKRINFPLILTDGNNDVIRQGMGGGVRNLEIDESLTEDEIEVFLDDKVTELGQIHDPIYITYQDSVVWGMIYYGDSKLIQNLRFFPFIQIMFALFFIVIAYISFSYIKKNEQSNIWVGMAKETAHQLGTPVSSLMGWAEILNLHHDKPAKVLDTYTEITNDLNRLNKIIQRFSKIGSKPTLKEESIQNVISRVISYFQRRLPQSGKNVSIKIEGERDSIIMMNPELFEWVIENLIKNALDAIGDKKGKIVFHISHTLKTIDIEVTDNGKGIDMKRRKDIFRPGYSTKRRGWGLGLSLTKRIIEDYHKGKIFVKHSVINEGTTIKIILNKS